MVEDKLRVAIIGYGKVGRVFGRAFPAVGYEVAAVVSRRVIVNCQSPIVNSVKELPEDLGFVLLCLRDQEIQIVVAELAEWRSSRGKQSSHPVIAHTAGALSAEVLAPLREHGCHTLAWHPLQTFTGDEGPELLRGVTFGLDGDEEAVKICEFIARDLGGIPFRVPPELRPLYHLGGVFACNLMAALIGQSLDLLWEVGMDQQRALQALGPLLESTLHNISRLGLPDALTGPIKRGDTETIQKHLDILSSRQEAKEIYRILSLALLRYLPEREENAGKTQILKKT